MSDAPTATGTRAVFLSYAREDAEAARRIADSLRAFGLEVWFDMNELRGGDQWDAKIRGQIRACALFIPIVSQRTEQRTEGYFRREWRIAVDRTQDMAGGRAFIVPVVIDETPESGALVPEDFMRVQWTRLPMGVPTPEFVQQVKRLVEGKGAAPLRGASPAPAAAGSAPARKVTPRWLWGALAALGIGLAAVLVFFRPTAPVTTGAPPSAPPEAAAAPAGRSTDKSIAVIPFANMSEEQDSAFFADGIHEDILTNLALIRELRVVSRTSVMKFRGTTKSMREIAQELGVTYILEGSVRRSGNKVRVTGQLIHAATDEHVWAQAYDRDLTDVFTIQAELSQQIAGALRAALSPQERMLIARKPTENPAAYDLFLRSRDLLNREGSTPAARRRRVDLLESAVALDPKFAQAWAELAAATAFLKFGNVPGGDAAMERAKLASEQALRLAPDDPEVIGNYGTYLYYGFRDYEGAAMQYRRLAALQPNSPVVYNSLALIQRRQGRWADSLLNSRRAVQLDPGNLQFWRNFLSTLQYARRWPEAIEVQQRIATMLPDDPDERYELARLHARATGSLREAGEFFRRLPPEETESPEGIARRKDWAAFTDNLEEFIRLDRIQPYHDGRGVPRPFQAFNAAWNYFLAGDQPGAVARLGDSHAELRKIAAAEPNNVIVQMSLAFVELMLGHPEAARRQAEAAAALTPESVDALDGPRWVAQRAVIYDFTGDHERALAEYQRLLSIPSMVTVGAIRISAQSVSAPLRRDPRFQALLDDPKNSAPLF